MSRPIPAGDYVEHCDPELPHHRAWLLAVLEQLVAHNPQALEDGGTLRRLWTARQEAGSAAPQTSAVVLLINTASRGNPLSVPWFVQLDSATDQTRRMCFSSSYAMLLALPQARRADRLHRGRSVPGQGPPVLRHHVDGSRPR